MSISASAAALGPIGSSAPRLMNCPLGGEASVEDLWKTRRLLVAVVREMYIEAARTEDFEVYEVKSAPLLREIWSLEPMIAQQPHSLNKLGAMMLFGLEGIVDFLDETPRDAMCESRVALDQLATLVPFLTGIIGDDARFLFENPDLPIRDLPFILH